MIQFITNSLLSISYPEILSDSVGLEKLDSFEQSILTFCKLWLSGKEHFHLFTSGSTGTPKPIVLSRKQMVNSAMATAKTLHLAKGDVALVCLNTAYIGGMMMLVRGMELGMNLYVVPPSSNPLKEIAPRKIDFFSFVPLQLQHVLSESNHWFDSLNQAKAILVGGATVSDTLIQQVQSLQAPVFNTYGMTETVSHIALKRLNGETPKDVFEVLRGVEIKTDERNCLTIKSEITDNQWITTNDIVQLISPTTFTWIGRVDNIINSGGIKIQLEEIEKQVAAFFSLHHTKTNCMAGGLPDEKLGEKLVLILEGNEDETLVKNLINYLQNTLPKYQMPKAIYFVERFEKTASDKIDRKKTLEKIV